MPHITMHPPRHSMAQAIAQSQTHCFLHIGSEQEETMDFLLPKFICFLHGGSGLIGKNGKKNILGPPTYINFHAKNSC